MALGRAEGWFGVRYAVKTGCRLVGRAGAGLALCAWVKQGYVVYGSGFQGVAFELVLCAGSVLRWRFQRSRVGDVWQPFVLGGSP